MADWSTRIPAAIEKAEKLTPLAEVKSGVVRALLTEGEVALAKALWNVLLNEGYGEGEPEDAEAALRDFTEKVESL